MDTSARGVAAIALHEGVVTKAYRDVAGVMTIGVGHTAAAGPPRPTAGMTITRQEALDIFASDLDKFEARVRKALPGVPQHVFDGAVSFDYNTGEIESATWVKLYRAGRMADAEASLKRWNRSGGRVVKGLVNRRAAEADLIFRGKYPSGVTVVALGPVPSSAYDDAAIIRGYQQQLAELRFDPGPIDGERGPKTKAALMAFQSAHGLVADGVYGPATKATLDTVHGERLGPDPTRPDKEEPQAEPPQPDDPGPEPVPPAAPGWLARFFLWLSGR